MSHESLPENTSIIPTTAEQPATEAAASESATPATMPAAVPAYSEGTRNSDAAPGTTTNGKPATTSMGMQVSNDPQLKELAKTANDNHNLFHEGCRKALPYARACGEALLKAKARVKELLGHGHWLEWLSKNFRASPDTAENYMKVAANWSRFERELETNPKLSIDGAIQKLRAPIDRHETVPPRTRKIVEPSPVALARDKIRKRFESLLKSMPEGELFWFAENGLNELDSAWSDARAKASSLSRIIGGPLLRRRQAESPLRLQRELLKQTGQPRPSDGPDAEWQRKMDEVELTFRRDVLRSLLPDSPGGELTDNPIGRDARLTHEERVQILHALGMWSVSDQGTKSDLERIAEGLPDAERETLTRIYKKYEVDERVREEELANEARRSEARRLQARSAEARGLYVGRQGYLGGTLVIIRGITNNGHSLTIQENDGNGWNGEVHQNIDPKDFWLQRCRPMFDD